MTNLDKPNKGESALLTTADGTPLRKALARAMRRARINAFLLVAPLLLFVVVTFAVPIGQMLYLSINNRVFSDYMPRVTAYLKVHPEIGVPCEDGFEALALDLAAAKKKQDDWAHWHPYQLRPLRFHQPVQIRRPQGGEIQRSALQGKVPQP